MIDGTELNEISEESLCQIIGVVQQETFIFDTSIKENICLFRDWPQQGIDKAIKGAGLRMLIAERGENTLCGENGSLLSGGEKQRISIARVLLSGAPVLLLDEATASLDNQTTSQIEQSIIGLQDVTKIVVTHKLDIKILSAYDEIIMMQDGHIAETGSLEKLISNKGAFYSLLMLDQQVAGGD